MTLKNAFQKCADMAQMEYVEYCGKPCIFNASDVAQLQLTLDAISFDTVCFADSIYFKPTKFLYPLNLPFTSLSLNAPEIAQLKTADTCQKQRTYSNRTGYLALAVIFSVQLRTQICIS